MPDNDAQVAMDGSATLNGTDSGLGGSPIQGEAFRWEMIRSELEDIVGEDHVSTKESDRRIYSCDWFWAPQMWLDRGQALPMPDVVVHPGSVQEISTVMELANAYKIPVVPWGGGSGSQGGALPLYGGILLDMKRLDQIIEINEQSMTVTAQAGVNGTHLEWALNDRGLTLPHYPASANCATVGGYLAPRGSGTISTKYGKIDDLLVNMEFVLPQGQVCRTSRVPRHSSGPDLSSLLLGAEGTTGIVTEATLAVDYLPQTRLFRALLFEDLDKAIEAGRQLMIRRLEPTVIRLYDPASTKSVVKKTLGLDLEGAYMVMGFDGDADIAALQESKAMEICAGLGAQDLGREPGERWWEHRYNFYYPPKALMFPWMYGTIESVATFDDVQGLFKAQKQAIEEGFEEWGASYIAHFSHWYHWGAEMYSRFIIEKPPEDPHEAIRLHNRVWSTAVHTAMEHGGMINAHHGVGLKLGRFMRKQYGPSWHLMRAVKSAVDPNGIMNPGKLGMGP